MKSLLTGPNLEKSSGSDMVKNSECHRMVVLTKGEE